MTDNKNAMRLNAVFDFQCFGPKLWIIPLLLPWPSGADMDTEQQCL